MCIGGGNGTVEGSSGEEENIVSNKDKVGVPERNTNRKFRDTITGQRDQIDVYLGRKLTCDPLRL